MQSTESEKDQEQISSYYARAISVDLNEKEATEFKIVFRSRFEITTEWQALHLDYSHFLSEDDADQTDAGSRQLSVFGEQYILAQAKRDAALALYDRPDKYVKLAQNVGNTIYAAKLDAARYASKAVDLEQLEKAMQDLSEVLSYLQKIYAKSDSIVFG